MSWDSTRDAFADGARWFGWLVGKVRDWDAPGLGEWTVRDLVGHTGRALSTVETYLAVPAAGVPADPPETAAAEAGALLAALAARSGRAGDLFRATTGRGPLPPTYTVL